MVGYSSILARGGWRRGERSEKETWARCDRSCAGWEGEEVVWGSCSAFVALELRSSG